MLRWLALGWLVASPSLAQVPGFELERVVPNAGSRDSLVLDTGDVLPAKALRVSLAAHYEHNPLVLVVNGERRGALVASRLTTHLSAAFGLSRWAEVGLQVPVVTYQAGDDLSALGYAAPSSFALGAPVLQGRFGVLQERFEQPIDLSLSVGLSLPLGSSDALTKDPGAGLALLPRVGVGRRLGLVRLGAEVGALVRGGAVLSPQSAAVSDEVGSLLTVGLAAATTNDGPRAELMLRGTFPFTHAPASLEVLAGARFGFLEVPRSTPGERLTQLELFVVGGPGIGHTPGTPAFRVLAGLAWTPRFDERAEPPAE